MNQQEINGLPSPVAPDTVAEQCEPPLLVQIRLNRTEAGALAMIAAGMGVTRAKLIRSVLSVYLAQCKTEKVKP